MNSYFAICKICKSKINFKKQEEDPKRSIGCFINWCPGCEEKANDYWQITSYIYPKRELSISKNKNQLRLF